MGDRPAMTSQVERLARVEQQVRALTENFNDHKKDTDERFDKIDKKLDDLLALRNKGAGVFWLISSLIGTGIVGALYQFGSWIMGK